jgi:hypothetical protein
MNRTLRTSLFLFHLGWVLGLPLVCQAGSGLAGNWTIDRAASSAIDPWRKIDLGIEVQGDAVTIDEAISAGRRKTAQVYPLKVGDTVDVPIEWWAGNRHIGAYIGGDKTQKMRAAWLDEGQTLRVESNFILTTSQGDTPVRTYTEYRLSPGGETLTVITLRSSRPAPIVHVYKRS